MSDLSLSIAQDDEILRRRELLALHHKECESLKEDLRESRHLGYVRIPINGQEPATFDTADKLIGCLSRRLEAIEADEFMDHSLIDVHLQECSRLEGDARHIIKALHASHDDAVKRLNLPSGGFIGLLASWRPNQNLTSTMAR